MKDGIVIVSFSNMGSLHRSEGVIMPRVAGSIVFSMALMCLGHNYSHAAETIPFSTVVIKGVTIQWVNQTSDLRGKPLVFKRTNSGGSVLQKMMVEGVPFFRLSVGGGFDGGCEIDGRWSSVDVLYKMGGRHSGKVDCSSNRDPSNRGTASFTSSMSRKRDLFTLAGQMKTERSFASAWDGKSRLRINSDMNVRLEISVKGKQCIVHSFVGHAKQNNAGVQTEQILSFSKKCDVH